MEPEPEKQQPQPEKKPKKEKERPKKEEKPQPAQEKPRDVEPKVNESKSQPEKEREREEAHHQHHPQPQIEQTHTADDADDGLRPTTAKTKPVARKKKGDNFDKIMVEEKTLPQGIIMDNEEDEHEEEKNTSFDHNVVANKNINADNINKKQHGYMVRDILENQGEEENKGHAAKEDKPKKEENKIRMGRIGTKKKEEKQGGAASQNTNSAQEQVAITVESIEDVEALRKAIQNLCQ